MKRLLLGPVLALPLFLGLCHFTTPKLPQLPKVPEVVKHFDDNDYFPKDGPLPDGWRRVPAEEFERANPAPVAPVKKPKVKKHAPSKRSAVPAHRPVPVPVPPVAELPPQQGPICIFPFNMIPNCTPQVSQ